MHVLDIDRVMLGRPDAKETIDRFEELLGLSFTDVVHSVTETGETVNRNDVAYAEPGLEVIAPQDDESGVSQFIEAHGPGLFGLVIRVADVEAAKAELAAKGVEPIADETPDDVREIHYHPEDFGGVYTLLTSYPHPGLERARD
jgi:4-hydroxyphenylpyruvate dioxygenase-like putative hemolysin